MVKGMNRSTFRFRRAFSLVELSIVLVILGLLVGGILAGKSLIHASELRSIGSDLQKFETAIYAFRDKYFALPGEITNATDIWGKDAARCNSASGSAAVPGTCNGNGDGQWTTMSVSAGRDEQVLLWQHLSLAGLLEAGYTGINGTAPNLVLPGVNVPQSRIPTIRYNGEYKTITFSANAIYFGSGSDATLQRPWAGGFMPEDTYNLDMKLDDGKPTTGRFYGANGNGYSNCLIAGPDYNLSFTGVECYGRWWMK